VVGSAAQVGAFTWVRFLVRAGACWLLCAALLGPSVILADEPGVAPGVPEPEHRNVIIQLFNWNFADIAAVIPTLIGLDYSHIHVSPPAVEDANDRALRSSQASTDGAARFLKDYVAENNDAAATTEHAFANAFSGAEDSLVGLIATGKLEFQSLVDSALADLARTTVRQTLAAPLAGALQSAFAGGGPGDLARSFQGCRLSAVQLRVFSVDGAATGIGRLRVSRLLAPVHGFGRSPAAFPVCSPAPLQTLACNHQNCRLSTHPTVTR
jgi:hypothetical protein